VAIIERDPVMILDRIRSMALEIMDEVFDVVVSCSTQKPIEVLRKKIGDLKTDFPINYQEAKGDPKKRQELRDAIKNLNDQIINLKITQDKIQLSFLYFKQGVQVAFNNVMLVYGVVASSTPSFALKGSGDIVMKADKSKKLYVSASQTVGGPTPAITEKLDTAEFLVKLSMKLNKRIKQGISLGKEGKDLKDN